MQGAVLGARDGVVSKIKVPVPAEAFTVVNGDSSHRNNEIHSDRGKCYGEIGGSLRV